MVIIDIIKNVDNVAVRPILKYLKRNKLKELFTSRILVQYMINISIRDYS